MVSARVVVGSVDACLWAQSNIVPLRCVPCVASRSAACAGELVVRG